MTCFDNCYAISCVRAYSSWPQGRFGENSCVLCKVSLVVVGRVDTGANGLGRPTGSGITCLPKSRKLMNAGSEKIVPLRDTARSWSNVSTRPLSSGLTPEEVCVSMREVDGVSCENPHQIPITTITPSVMRMIVLCFPKNSIFFYLSQYVRNVISYRYVGSGSDLVSDCEDTSRSMLSEIRSTMRRLASSSCKNVTKLW